MMFLFMLGVLSLMAAAVAFFTGAYFVAVVLLILGVGFFKWNNKIEDNKLKELFDQDDEQTQLIVETEYIGKTYEDIEGIIGPHSSVNVLNNGSRVYVWTVTSGFNNEDSLELLFNKKMKCIEVLTNTFKD